jgi:hypothetical protein
VKLTVLAVSFIEAKDDFCIGVCCELLAVLKASASKLEVVIDFAVEHDRR